MNDGTIPRVYLKDMDTGTEVDVPVAVVPTTRMKFNLICASKCKKFALEIARSNPAEIKAKKFTRVSQEFLLHCEANLKEFIRNRVRSHPSKGKTLM
jgi:hypothetical protein